MSCAPRLTPSASPNDWPKATENTGTKSLTIAPTVPASQIDVASTVTKSGYSLEARIPGRCLSGFDPAEHPRIGFYYILEDGDHGQQYLTVGDDLNWHIDPSTWATAVLSPDAGRRSPARRRT